jgi:hypothetical protein
MNKKTVMKAQARLKKAKVKACAEGRDEKLQEGAEERLASGVPREGACPAPEPRRHGYYIEPCLS